MIRNEELFYIALFPIWSAACQHSHFVVLNKQYLSVSAVYKLNILVIIKKNSSTNRKH